MKKRIGFPIALALMLSLLLCLLSGCANPPSMRVPAPADDGGAVTGDSANKIPTDPLPKEYKLGDCTFQTATAADLNAMKLLAQRIVAECDTAILPLSLSEEKDGTLFDLAKQGSKTGSPYAFACYATQIAELIQGQTRRGADGTTVISLCGLRAEQKTSNRTEGDIAMEQRALAHLIFLAMLDQNPDDYCFVVHWLFDDPDLYRQLNVNMDGLIVCTEYQSHGYSSVTAYYDAVRSGQEENHGDLYTVSLGSTNVSLFPNTP